MLYIKGIAAVTVGLALALGADEIRCERIFQPDRLLWGNENNAILQSIDRASWIWHGNFWNYDRVNLRFRNDFSAVSNSVLELSVSADERFVLLLDGRELARGPHRCLPLRWTFQSYRINLPGGKHRLEAVVTRERDFAPVAQLTDGGGFVLKAEGSFDKVLTTGKGAWRVAQLKGTSSMRNGGWTFTGGAYTVKGCSLLEEEPPADAWREPMVVAGGISPNDYGCPRGGWRLAPSTLPDMIARYCTPGSFKSDQPDGDRFAPYNAALSAGFLGAANALLREGKAFTIPSKTKVRLLWDLGDYYCAFPELRTGGGQGAVVEWDWSEALYDPKGIKPARNLFDGLRLQLGNCKGDRFMPDGRANARFTTPWWRCGRWCQLTIVTGDEPLTLSGIGLVETRYPLENESRFICDDSTIAPILRLASRGMQMCCHEMLFDCPFYEQQMYPGDTRVQLQVISAMTRDDRMVRRAIELFDFSRRLNGFVGMNYPTRGTQDSGTYTLCWLLMFKDYLYWHDNFDWLKARVPGMRAALHGLAAYECKDGLLRYLPGWSFMDWVPKWPAGIAPDGNNASRASSLNNLFYVLALQSAAEMEDVVGDKAMADYWRAKADRLGNLLVEKFWSEPRGLIADTEARNHFSEHGQCLAILAGILTPAQERRAFKAMQVAPDLSHATVYFSHYLLDVYGKMGRGDLILKRLDLWRDYVKNDLKTPLEGPGNFRSDCHAWGAHPLFHLQKGVAGVMPVSPGFRRVRVAPSPGELKHLDVAVPHPKGFVELMLDFDGKGGVKGCVTLPEKTDGEFVWGCREVQLKSGANTIEF
ncbi:MAG: alpha-L-rhamnosidase C-terminal domain-containing protein [Kiritimatiellia bacterium]